MPLYQDPERGVIMGDKRLLLKSVTKTAAGSYQCVATNIEGSSSSESTYLRVQCEYSFAAPHICVTVPNSIALYILYIFPNQLLNRQLKSFIIA
jgi:hypothetical protein